MTRLKLRKLLAAVCEHDIHASRLAIQYHDFYRSCQNINMEEITMHILCQCPSFEEARLKYLGQRFLDCFSEISKENGFNMNKKLIEGSIMLEIFFLISLVSFDSISLYSL